MTRLAQSTSCQHRWLMCTDNFIPPPLTPSPFLSFFIWLFISCPPASQPVTCYLSTWSQLSALWLLASEWGSCLKAVLELYSERCFCPLETLKIWDCDSECATMRVCVCVQQLWEDSVRMSVFMAHCTGTAAQWLREPFTYTDYVTSALLVPPPLRQPPPFSLPSSPPCMHTTLLLYPLHLL